MTTGMVEPAEMAAIARAGGVGEMLGHFFAVARPPLENELPGASSPSRSTTFATAASSPSPAAR